MASGSRALRAVMLVLVTTASPTVSSVASGAAQASEDKERWFAEVRAKKEVPALRIEHPIVIDGKLEEPGWSAAEPARDFYQQVPDEGALTTEATEVRFLYDEDNLYVGALLFDADVDKMVVNELTRDFSYRNGDAFSLVLDTFHDKRNTVSFATNPAGAKRDLQTYDEGRQTNADWDAVWYVKTGSFEAGWTVEMAIPFKSLRFFQPEAAREWGLQVMRIIRRKNEITMWSPVARQFNEFRNSYHGVLTHIEGVRPGRDASIKPFVLGGAESGLGDDDAWSNHADGGLDLKYGLASSLTLDASWRTDFAQVEADAQQVNLTRFSLSFPEKREFFLENQGSFQVGDLGRQGGGDGPLLLPFFSRRIGLRDGEPIPILAGARVTGKTGRLGVGLLNMQTNDHDGIPGANYTAIRLSREIRRNSAVGAYYFGRESRDAEGHTRVAGADVRLNFNRTIDVDAFVLRSSTRDEEGDPWAGRGAFRWTSDLYTTRLAFTHIGEGYRNDLGFAPRRGVGITTWELERNLRPKNVERLVRQFTIGTEGSLYSQTNFDSWLSRNVRFDFSTEFQDGGRFGIDYDRIFEVLEEPFEIHDGISIPTGTYRFDQIVINYFSDSSKWLSGSVRYTAGGFWDGDISGWRGGLRARASEHLAAELSYERNSVDLASGGFDTDLAALRVDYSFTTNMFLNAFIQYNSVADAWFSNVRFNFIHRPLSDVFLVYNEVRPGEGPTARAFTVKYTYRIGF